MKTIIFKYIKRMLLGIGILLGILVITYVAFVNFSPQFGGKISEEAQQDYQKSENYKDGKFINKKEINMDMKFSDMVSMMFKFFRSDKGTVPETPVDVQKIDSTSIANYRDTPRLIWFGHSTFLLQMAEKNILIDPMLGEVPAPHPMLGTKRFSKELPIAIEQLPHIDAVVISHDHYDHLDYNSIQKLKSKVAMFYTPLGVSAHLQEWGVDKARIKELDWWQEVQHEGITFKCAPARHFSGRGFGDRFQTLWSSWVIQSEDTNIFFSGDSGYGDHFKTIGETYGPFDFAMMECGQYNKLWPEVHMFPEETAQAGLDVKAKRIMPIHWGAFKLAMHTWTDPIERVAKKAKELQIDLVAPQIGEPVYIEADTKTQTPWWH